MLPLLTLLLLILTAAAAAHPQRDDPIAIVGAGFSGVSSAYHLAAAGHTNITIYETELRPGGSATSVVYKNVTHDMAPYGITAIYWKFKAAAEKLGFSFCPFDSAVIFPSSPPTVVDTPAFFASVSAPTLPDPTQYRTLLVEQITRYAELWSFLFEVSFLNDRLETDRLFPTRPTNKDKLRRLSTPMLDFLKEENLELLIPIFRQLTDTQAYGPIGTTAAIYFMTWAAPSVVLPTAEAYVPCDAGFGDMLSAMLDRLLRGGQVTMQYGVRVKRVKRGRKFARVITADGAVDKFGAVIVTSKLEKRARRSVVKPLTIFEKRASRKIEELELYTVMLEGSRETAVAPSALLQIVSGPLIRPSPNAAFWGATLQETRSPGGPFHSDESTIVKIGYLFSYKERALGKRFRLSMSRAMRMVLEGMKLLDDTVWRAIQGYRYMKYFQRWRPEHVAEGLPWVLEESQGIGNVYYVNAAACGFEAWAQLFECAELVAKRIVRHQEGHRNGAKLYKVSTFK